MAESSSTPIYKLADKILDIVYLILISFFIIVTGLLLFYCYLIIQPATESLSGAASKVQSLVNTLWNSIVPYISHFLNLIAPVFILLFALGVLYKLGTGGASPFNTQKLLNDLPSLLALIIIISICLLPFAGIEVPEVLSNVALVVVGFYFGKNQITNSSGTGGG